MYFVGGNRHRVRVIFSGADFLGTKEYQQSSEGAWQLAEEIKGLPEAASPGFKLAVKESLDEPPRLIATSKPDSKVILDPNPQLKNLELASAEVYTWKDEGGSVWRGGLYKPSHFEPGKRYPLVIQTHGFVDFRYIPSGLYQAGFAARALAAQGITVLQVDDGQCYRAKAKEVPCAISGYEAAADHLVKDGTVDPEKIGIIGFSHSCFWVMGTLTSTSSLHVKAASVTDGVMADYNQYLTSDASYAHYFDDLIGAQPIGQGLKTWLERSPGFNLERVSAPLLVVGEGPKSLHSMWQPYAILHLLKKPVELIMLNTNEHDLSNPAVRLASQGGSVDWFRFWLQNYEDPDPAKAEQYKRWRELRKMQTENDASTKGAPAN
jgi:dipeptidyl aminopeptidase/acylaminoacyl peptidase